MQEIKMNGESLNIEQENIAKLKEIFPEVFNEDKIDFEKLQNVLGHYIDTDEEKYRFTWNGKMDALRLSQTPSTGTLRPCKEESRDWDTTQNLYIEGDNLEVLKLLQNSYLNKIKMIYIDPPYNTGNDFVYKDDFKDNITNYKKMTGQIDSDGNSTSTNKETDGRYHTNWLNMIYPRLRLARNLLTDDGVIFISIDDNEVTNLKKICDEIFGIDNFINIISAKTKNIAGASGGGEDKRLKKNIEYILIYAKNYDAIEPFKKIYNRTEISELLNKYREENISWKYTSILRKRGEKIYFKSTLDGDGNEIKIYKRINPEYSSVSQIMKEENISEAAVYVKYFHDIYTTAMPQSSIRVRVMDAINEDNNSECDLYSIEYVPKTGKNKGKVYEQFYKGDKFRLFTWFSDVAEMENGIVYKNDMLGTLWDKINLNNLTKEGNIKYDNGKKPIELVKKLIEIFKKNPQSYMTEVAKIIQRVLRDLILDGIKYTKLGDDYYYAQELLKENPITGYLERNMLETNSNKYPFTHVVYDSDNEASFAEQFENNRHILKYVKLPSQFKVPTPLGPYNPDWAVLVDKNGEKKLYFVLETKRENLQIALDDDLRQNEKDKIYCGRKHFEAIKTDAQFEVVTNFDKFIQGVTKE